MQTEENENEVELSAILVSPDATLASAVGPDITSMTRFRGEVVTETLATARDAVIAAGPTVVIADIEEAGDEALDALADLAKALRDRTRIVVIAKSLDPATVRMLFQLRIADLLIKPVEAADVVRAVHDAANDTEGRTQTEAEIYTFLAAAGGVGATTLALETAGLLVRRGSTCVVDLNLQSGSCAEYLDLKPAFDMSEVENNPDRLDSQLLETMIVRHSTGICVVSAPPDPASAGMTDPALVARILDLAAEHFRNVVIDLPRIWLSWTDSVLLGSDHLYVVGELTAPCLRQIQRLNETILRRTDNAKSPKVILNRVDNRKQAGWLTIDDARNVLGDHLAGHVSNQHSVVRQALDRGVTLTEQAPKNLVTQDMRSIILPDNTVARRSLLARFRRKAA